MRKGRLLLGALLLTSGLALPALSQAGVAVDIDLAPPAPQVEVVPPPRPGYVWAPGYWNWEGGRHVWVGGHWMGERPGYHWAPDHWEHRGPHYHYEPGHWER
jgi:hypothetical protein